MNQAGSLGPETEHYVTCFDHRFLLQGLALHESLRRHHPGSFLWVLALDDAVATQLRQLRRSRLAVLPLPSVESPRLKAAKKNRSWAEYIYTLTPFTFDLVFGEDASVRRLTYVDADLCFFRNPAGLFGDLERQGGGILVTEHGYAPEHRALEREFGRFCVQFLTVTRDPDCLGVIRRWQMQCLESCSTASIHRSQVYGDQKYLDDWPETHRGVVRIAAQARELLGPWNVDHHQRRAARKYWPVFYHFHSFRIFRPDWVQLCTGYNPRRADHLYTAYLHLLRRLDEKLGANGIGRPFVPFAGDRWWLPRLGWRLATGRASVRRWPTTLPAFGPE